MGLEQALDDALLRTPHATTHDDAHTTTHSHSATPAGSPVARIGYADDTFIDGTASQVAAAWPLIQESLTAAGHEVQPAKCHLWAASERVRSTEDAEALVRLSQSFPLSTGNLCIMGTEAGAGYSTVVSSTGGAAAVEAAERARQAAELCEHISELATADLGAPRLAAAWTLLTKCAARALDYDARLVPPEVLRPVTSALDFALRRAAGGVCGKDFCDSAWAQATLPGPLAGCGVRLPSAVLTSAFWSSWEAHEVAAREFSRQLGRTSDHTRADAEAAQAAEGLRGEGLIVARQVAPTLTPPAHDRLSATPWAGAVLEATTRPGGSIRQMGAILRLLEGLKAADLWTSSDKVNKERLLSAGGPRTGMTWTALPDPGQATMPDEHWRIATANRLGLLQCQPGTPCGLQKSRGGRCGKALDTRMRHIWHCRTGNARLRIHDAIVGTLAKELRSAGGNADQERAMPSLARITESGELEEAIMDATCWFPSSLDWYGIDVTVRYAGATRYVGSHRRAGVAAARGEQEKKARYGNGVLPLAFEAGGRLGEESDRTLQRLADAAAANSNGFTTRRGLAARWRRRLEAALLFASADTVLCALGRGTQGSRVAAPWCSTSAVPPATQAMLEDAEVAASADELAHEDCLHDGLAALLAEDEEAAQAMHGDARKAVDAEMAGMHLTAGTQGREAEEEAAQQLCGLELG